MTRLQLLAVRLVDGSGILFRLLGDRTAAWVRKGRRDDLTGIPALLGVLLRMVIVAVGLWALWRLVRAVPNVLWLLTTLWCWCAARATRPGKEAVDTPSAEPDTAPDPDAVRTLLEGLIGDRPGVHLSTVLAHLHKQGQGEGWSMADLRARLEAAGVPVRRSVKVARRVAYGVHRDDLTAPSPETATETAA